MPLPHPDGMCPCPAHRTAYQRGVEDGVTHALARMDIDLQRQTVYTDRGDERYRAGLLQAFSEFRRISQTLTSDDALNTEAQRLLDLEKETQDE